MSVCITGARGFIGASLVQRLVEAGRSVVALQRNGEKPARHVNAEVRWIQGELSGSAAPLTGVGDIECVIHLAGLAHRSGRAPRGSDFFMEQNCACSVRVAEHASQLGARRFVFISSIAVFGDALGRAGTTISERTEPLPSDPYGASKLAAEEALRSLSDRTGLELVVIRPALVVGQNAPGNLQRLAALISRGVPFPVPLRDNCRSYISLDNLCELITVSIDHASAAGNTFIAANDELVSTREVVQWIGAGMGRAPRTTRLPASVISSLLTVVGQRAVYRKLYGDLIVTSKKAQRMLQWRPAVSLEASFREFGLSYSER